MKINGNPDGGGGASAVIEGLSITSNGTYTAGAGVDGYSPIEVDVPSPEFVTETLNVTVNNTYYPGAGVDGFSQVVVDVPQSVTGFTQKEITEGVQITDLNNSASYVHANVFEGDVYLQTVNLPNCKIVNPSAFQGCVNLEAVSLPTCSFIGYSAFYGCSNLTSLYAPECKNISEYAFYNCRNIQNVNLPELTIGSGSMFGYCSSLISVNLPKVQNVEAYMFTNCINLERINIPNCSFINYYAFYRCSKLTEISLPNCFSIQSYVFAECRSLSNVYLPNCSFVYYSAFNDCPLESIDLTHTVTLGAQFYSAVFSEMSLPCISNFTIGYVFSRCSNLVSLTLGTGTYQVPSYNNALVGTQFINGSGVIYVDAAMYDKWTTASGWSSLSSRFVSVGNTDPMVSFSDGVVYGKTKILTERVTAGENLNIPASYVNVFSLSNCDYVNTSACINYGSLTSIDLPVCSIIRNNAFGGLRNLSDVSLPKVKYIDNGAFNNCNSLTSIYLPECKMILNNAFEECHYLSIISLPVCEYIGSSAFKGTMQKTDNYLSINLPVCSYIGDYGFYWCEKLKSITLGSTSVCVLGGNTVFGTTSINVGSIFVPASLVDAYKSAEYWSAYSNRIFPIE